MVLNYNNLPIRNNSIANVIYSKEYIKKIFNLEETSPLIVSLLQNNPLYGSNLFFSYNKTHLVFVSYSGSSTRVAIFNILTGVHNYVLLSGYTTNNRIVMNDTHIAILTYTSNVVGRLYSIKIADNTFKTKTFTENITDSSSYGNLIDINSTNIYLVLRRNYKIRILDLDLNITQELPLPTDYTYRVTVNEEYIITSGGLNPNDLLIYKKDGTYVKSIQTVNSPTNTISLLQNNTLVLQPYYMNLSQVLIENVDIDYTSYYRIIDLDGNDIQNTFQIFKEQIKSVSNEDSPINIPIQKINTNVTTEIVSQPLNGKLEFNTTNSNYDFFIFTPNENWFGEDKIIFKQKFNGLESSNITCNIFVNNINEPPIIDFIEDIEILEDTSIDIELIANDVDSNGEIFTFGVSGMPLNINYTLNNNILTLTPSPNIVTQGEITVWCKDSTNLYSYRKFNITVRNVNDKPNIFNTTLNVNEDSILTYKINGVDVDNTELELTYILQDTTTNGELLFLEDGNFTYTPNTNFFGNDSFTFIMNDGLLDSDLCTIDIIVQSINDKPIINEILEQKAEQFTILKIEVSSTDVDNDIITYSVNGSNIINSTQIIEDDKTYLLLEIGSVVGESLVTVTAKDNGINKLTDSTQFKLITERNWSKASFPTDNLNEIKLKYIAYHINCYDIKESEVKKLITDKQYINSFLNNTNIKPISFTTTDFIFDNNAILNINKLVSRETIDINQTIQNFLLITITPMVLESKLTTIYQFSVEDNDEFNMGRYDEVGVKEYILNGVKFYSLQDITFNNYKDETIVYNIDYIPTLNSDNFSILRKIDNTFYFHEHM